MNSYDDFDLAAAYVAVEQLLKDAASTVDIDVDIPEFWASRASLEALYINAAARRLSPWALLGHACARALYTVPPTVHLRSFLGDAPLNHALVCVGNSAAGKSVIRGVLDQALEFAAQPVFPDPFMAGSGESMPDAYVGQDKNGNLEWRRHAIIWDYDEVGTADKVSDRKGATIWEYIKTGWSGGALGRMLAGGKSCQVPSKQYRFLFTTNAQPGRSGVLLTAAQIAGGLPQRFVWANADMRVPKVDRNVRRYHVVPAINWSDVPCIPATEEMDDYFDLSRETASAIDGHAALSRAKIAVALAVLDGRAELNHEDWELAGEVMAHSDATRAYAQAGARAGEVADAEEAGFLQGVKSARAAETADERLVTAGVKRVLAIFKEEGGAVTVTQLNRKLGSYYYRALDRILYKVKDHANSTGDTNLLVWVLALIASRHTGDETKED